MNGEWAGKSVLSENVVTLSSEMVHFTVKSSVMMLPPSHTIPGLVNWNIFFGENTSDMTNTTWINWVNPWNAGWESAGWSPGTIVTGETSGHWNWRGKFKAFWTGWDTNVKTYAQSLKYFFLRNMWLLEFLAKHRNVGPKFKFRWKIKIFYKFCWKVDFFRLNFWLNLFH